ncbi:MAG: PD-(D/E)XK nuclease family protein [Candidatus Shapirobacteria bacterium]
MSEFYKPNKQLGLYENKTGKAFKMSRSKIDLFIQCQRCFYLDRVLGIGRPPGFPFSLNSAVDKLLKKEFDIHRAEHTTHPLMKAYGLDAIPFEHPKMNEWRENFKGITYLDPDTNLLITGAVDDVWIKSNGELIIVDYKSTSKESEVNLDAQWQDGYKRQMEIYQWLFRKNGFTVSDTGYFVYCNGKTDKEAFDAKLEFDIKLLPYTGKTDWIEPTIKNIYECLNSEIIPRAADDCDYCNYVKSREGVK